MSYYTLDEVDDLLAVSNRIKADLIPTTQGLTPVQIQQAANGVGPDSFPSIVRQVLSVLLPYADVATMWHDSEYQYVQDASKEAWQGANLRFYRNCLKRIKDLYGWYDPRRYINNKRAIADYALLGGDISWEAWLAAKKRYIKS
jgi:hypothetical protein